MSYEITLQLKPKCVLPSTKQLKAAYKLKVEALFVGNPLFDVISFQLRDRRPGGGRSKAKGNAFEIVIAKQLGEWWCGTAFRRVPMSGAWCKLSTDGKVFTTGDIFADPTVNFPFSVECKKQNVDVNALNIKDPIHSWWAQCVEDANSASKLPLLIYSENNRDPVVVFTDAVKIKPDVIVGSVASVPAIPVMRMMLLSSFLENFIEATHAGTTYTRISPAT